MIKKYYLDKNINRDIPKNVACIGFFDGVHKGHQKLIEETIKIANTNNLESLLITFDPDPKEIVNGKKTQHLCSLKKKIELIEDYGIHNVLIIRFDDKLTKMEPNIFIEKILNNLNIYCLVAGYDFSFGDKGKGNLNYLKSYKNRKFNIKEVEEVSYYGKKISSTRIKNELNKGNIEFANRMLGYKYKK